MFLLIFKIYLHIIKTDRKLSLESSCQIVEDFKLVGSSNAPSFFSSHMIPVPPSELHLYDIENEKDDTYKDLVQNEIIFIRKNQDRILANAKLLYKQKAENDLSAGYVKAALEYKALEKLCRDFISEKK